LPATCTLEKFESPRDRDRLAHNLEVEEHRAGVCCRLVGWLSAEFPGGDLSIRERLVKVVGHRELGDLAELAGAAAVARCSIALEAVLPGRASQGRRLRWTAAGWSCGQLTLPRAEAPKPFAETSATVDELGFGQSWQWW
jgi:hypothetical protein